MFCFMRNRVSYTVFDNTVLFFINLIHVGCLFYEKCLYCRLSIVAVAIIILFCVMAKLVKEV